MQTSPAKKYHPYGDEFLVNRIDLKKIVKDLVGLGEIPAPQDIDIVDDQYKEWIHDRSQPEVEFDEKQLQLYEQE